MNEYGNEQKIDEAFQETLQRIKQSFLPSLGVRKILSLLDHISSCKKEICPKCPKTVLNRYLILWEENNEKDLSDLVAALIHHALQCMNDDCAVQRCDEARNWVKKLTELSQLDSGIVKFSNTSWFHVNNIIQPHDYQFFCKFHLGYGAYAEVEYQWLYRNDFQDVAVAVKKAHYDVTRRDIQISKLGSHPNIMASQLIITDEIDELKSCMIMRKADCTLTEYVNARTKLKNNQPITPTLSLLFMHQILCGLSFLHCNRLLHGDLKGRNIMLTHHMQRLEIADFSSVMDFTHQPTELSGHFTPGYRPPEVFNGEVAVLPPLDIYSFGVVAIEIYYGDMTQPIIYPCSIIQRDQAYVKEIRKVFPAIGSLIQCLVNIDPTKRPTADQALSMIKDTVDDLKMAYGEATCIDQLTVPFPIRKHGEVGWLSPFENVLMRRITSHMDCNVARDLPLPCAGVDVTDDEMDDDDGDGGDGAVDDAML